MIDPQPSTPPLGSAPLLLQIRTVSSLKHLSTSEAGVLTLRDAAGCDPTLSRRPPDMPPYVCELAADAGKISAGC